MLYFGYTGDSGMRNGSAQGSESLSCYFLLRYDGTAIPPSAPMYYRTRRVHVPSARVHLRRLRYHHIVSPVIQKATGGIAHEPGAVEILYKRTVP